MEFHLIHLLIFTIISNSSYLNTASAKVKKAVRYPIHNIDNSVETPSELYMDSMQLIRKYGYQGERHEITTEDGYIITSFRIRRKGPAVLVMHGITDSSDAWLTLGPEKGLACALANNNYDVWLLNVRGNKYSKKHKKTMTLKAYWQFSFEKMGYFDLTAAIDYVLRKTKQSKIFYIGFSQGTTIFFSMTSLRPEYNAKIRHAFLLGPVAWMQNVKHPIINYFSENLKEFKAFLDSMSMYELFPSSILLDAYHGTACRKKSLAKILCDLEFFVSFGLHNSTHIPQDRFPIIASHVPAGTSVDSFVHYITNYKTGKFQRFDYGAEENLRVYGKVEPLEFDLNKVTVPVTLYASEQDWYANPKDVAKLLQALPNVKSVVYFNKDDDFNHLEFAYGDRAKIKVYNPLLEQLTEIADSTKS